MIATVKQRLNSFGYQTVDSDLWLLTYVIEKSENHIKNYCNISEIPNELQQVMVDMAVGFFLFEKKSMTKENESLLGFDLDLAIKQIQEGDTSVTYAIGDGNTTPEQRLNELINYLIHSNEKDLVSYRTMKW